MKIALVIFVVLFHNTSWADPNLQLLSGSEWKGSCRKVVSESGKEINKQPYSRLQSTYTLESGNFSWAVKSFKDSECKSLYEVNKYTFQCTSRPKDKYASCKQLKWEYSKNEKDWESKPMVDHAGAPNISEIQTAANLSKPNKIELTIIGESGIPEKEFLAK